MLPTKGSGVGYCSTLVVPVWSTKSSASLCDLRALCGTTVLHLNSHGVHGGHGENLCWSMESSASLCDLRALCGNAVSHLTSHGVHGGHGENLCWSTKSSASLCDLRALCGIATEYTESTEKVHVGRWHPARLSVISVPSVATLCPQTCHRRAEQDV